MRLSRVRLHEEVRRWSGDALLPDAHRRTWVVTLETDQGASAAGEVAWLPRHGPCPDVPSLVAAWAWGWLGRPVPAAEASLALPGPVAWAITTALAVLHGCWTGTGPLPENGLLHAERGDPAAVGRAWSAKIAASPSVRTWKVKVGRLSFDEDLARLRALSLPPGVRLRLDPNQRWGHLDPEAVADALQGLPLDYIEQPVRWPALADWAQAGVPCAADESLSTVPINTLADAGLQAVVVKPGTVGGLGAVQALVAHAAARGLDVVVSSSLEGPVGRGHLVSLGRMLPAPRPAMGLARGVLQDPPVATTLLLDLGDEQDPLARAAARFPDAIALEDGDQQMSFSAWHEAAAREAVVLGDRTGIPLAVEVSGMQGAVRLFAAFRAGALAGLVPPGPGRDAAAAAVGLASWGPGTGQPPGIGVAKPATLLWSSGSQGAPRALVHSLGQHLSSAAASHVHTPFASGDRWIAALRMHHVGGLALLFRALHAGGTVVFARQQRLHDLAPTHLSWVPTQLVRAERSPPQTLRHLLLGGAAAPPGLVEEKRRAGWPVKTTYGSTELASQVCTSTLAAPPAESGAPLACREVRVDSGIRVRGTTTCLGIWSDGGIVPLADADGWLETGDQGCLTATGTLQVLGRADTMFISGGENVFPETIERALGEHPAVRRVVVVDVPDPVWGARPWAFVDGNLGLDEARTHCRARLPRHAWVDRVLPWDDAGVGATGKPRRAWFRATARSLLRGDG